VKLLAQGNNGSSAEVTVNVETFVGGPLLSADPSFVEAGARSGEITVAATTITNRGTEPLLNARLLLPAVQWMQPTIGPEIGDIPAGDDFEIGLSLIPDENVEAGLYVEALRIESDNHIPFTVFFSVRVITDESGDLLVRAGDLLVTEVPIEGLDVFITQDTESKLAKGAPSTALQLTGKTDADGTLLFKDLPPGEYKYTLAGRQYQTATGRVQVDRGAMAEIHEFMRRNFVNVGFNVRPITIEDRYEITLEATFETQVLAPVLQVTPPHLEIMPVAGTQIRNNAVLTNHGLIAIRDVQFPRLQTADYVVEPLVTEIGDLGAQESLQVPFRIVTPFPEGELLRKSALKDGRTKQIKDLFEIVCDIFDKCDFDPNLCIYGPADLCAGPTDIVACIRFSVLCKIIPKIPTSLSDLLFLFLPEDPTGCAKEALEGGGVPGTGCLCGLAGAISGNESVTPCCNALIGLGLKDMYDCMCKLTQCDCPSGAGGGGNAWAQGGGGGYVNINPGPCE
jgi:hypothetical protein